MYINFLIADIVQLTYNTGKNNVFNKKKIVDIAVVEMIFGIIGMVSILFEFEGLIASAIADITMLLITSSISGDAENVITILVEAFVPLISKIKVTPLFEII